MESASLEVPLPCNVGSIVALWYHEYAIVSAIVRSFLLEIHCYDDQWIFSVWVYNLSKG